MAFDTGRINPDTGKRIIKFKAPRFTPFGSTNLKEIAVPCGKCVACLSNRRREWVNRMCLELFSAGSASFITLTYRDGCCPSNLCKKDLQNFFKRLRFASRDYSVPSFKLRYFGCGEYGKTTHRPHYHAILFGVDILSTPAWEPYICGFLNSGRPRFSSLVLEKIWPYGFCVVGDCTYQSIRYVSKYISKQYALRSDDDIPPFTLKSIGLGRSLFVQVNRKGRTYDYKLLPPFFDRFPEGFVVLPSASGFSPVGLPRVLDRYAERFAPELFESVKASRLDFANHFHDLVSPSVRGEYHTYKLRTELNKGQLDNE